MSRFSSRLWAVLPVLRKNWKYIAGGLSVVVLCLVLRQLIVGSEANAAPPAGTANSPNAIKDSKVTRASATSPADAQAASRPGIVAVVNGEQIERQELARACLTQYGKEVLETMVNRQLISEHCKRQGITISQAELEGEIDRTARRFRLSVEEYLKMLKQERNVTPQQYAQDIVWPTLALRRLASAQLIVSEAELRDAFETEYGPVVRARLISVSDAKKAQQIQTRAKTNPDDFGNLAKQYSEDINSASQGGIIQPIRKNVGDKQIEQVAFQLQEGVSPVIPVDGQYVILKCEGLLQTHQNINKDQVREQLAESIKERKLRAAAGETFKTLQKNAEIKNILNDPNASQQYPGVAATINGQPISLRDLSEECIERHGLEVLESVISHRVLEQALAKQKMTVDRKDLNSEVAQAALAMNKTTPDGKPDVQLWLATVTKQTGATVDTYIEQSVWPSAVLKKLVGEVEVTPDDIKKGFDANYGPRARCRAIVMSNQRKAQEVWEMARSKPTVENFGQLAEQYSIEPGSKALQGKVPPIPRNGGNPLLEKEAFALQKGELSGIVQLGDKFVILFCDGYTEPTKIALQEVQQEIYADIHEKKQRLAMAKAFDDLKEGSRIDNMLAGTSKEPRKSEPGQRTAAPPAAATTASRQPAASR